MSKEAKIVPLSELMGDNIGESPRTVEKQKSDEDLAKAIEGQDDDLNFFNLDEAKKKAEGKGHPWILLQPFHQQNRYHPQEQGEFAERWGTMLPLLLWD